MIDARQLLTDLFDTAIEAVRPEQCLPAYIPEPPVGRCCVFGAGKAAAAMAAALEAHWHHDIEGLVVVPRGHACACERIDVVEAAHPVPDQASVDAAKRMMDMASGLGPDDLALCLFSGGGSSVLCLPADGVTLDQKQELTRQMLRSGKSIAEINAARMDVSGIKGGKLADACAPARIVTLVMSDVPGDDPALVASGPSIGRASDHNNSVHVIARSQDALHAAWYKADELGVRAEVLGIDIQGEACVVAAEHASVALHLASSRGASDPPCVLLSGGELSVTVTGDGSGGRNSEYALALAIELSGHDKIWAFAADTDGIDGNSTAAGAFVTPDTLQRAEKIEIDAAAMLARNDSNTLFSRLGDAYSTGPTRVNVNDFRALLIQ